MLNYLKTNGLVIVLIVMMIYQQSVLSSVWDDVDRANSLLADVELHTSDISTIAFYSEELVNKVIGIEVITDEIVGDMRVLHFGYQSGDLCNR